MGFEGQADIRGAESRKRERAKKRKLKKVKGGGSLFKGDIVRAERGDAVQEVVPISGRCARVRIVWGKSKGGLLGETTMRG